LIFQLTDDFKNIDCLAEISKKVTAYYFDWQPAFFMRANNNIGAIWQM
jgi:hypothetical protein